MTLPILLELGLGTALLLFVWPHIRRVIATNGLPKIDTVLPVGAPLRTKAFLLAFGITAGLIMAAILVWLRITRLLALPTWVFLGVGYGMLLSSTSVLWSLALEWIELRPLAPKHPWRERLDELQLKAGGKLLPIYYRETSERVPYLTARGIILPCGALQSRAPEQLQSDVAGLLYDAQQGSVKKAWQLWLTAAATMLAVSLIGAPMGKTVRQLLFFLTMIFGMSLSYLPFSIGAVRGAARNKFIDTLVNKKGNITHEDRTGTVSLSATCSGAGGPVYRTRGQGQ